MLTESLTTREPAGLAGALANTRPLVFSIYTYTVRRIVHPTPPNELQAVVQIYSHLPGPGRAHSLLVCLPAYQRFFFFCQVLQHFCFTSKPKTHFCITALHDSIHGMFRCHSSPSSWFLLLFYPSNGGPCGTWNRRERGSAIQFHVAWQNFPHTGTTKIHPEDNYTACEAVFKRLFSRSD